MASKAKGRFACACTVTTSQLHEEWECPNDSPLISKLRKSVIDKLLSLVGKERKGQKFKSEPRFCIACVNKVYELFPNLCEEKPPSEGSVHGEHSYSNPTSQKQKTSHYHGTEVWTQTESSLRIFQTFFIVSHWQLWLTAQVLGTWTVVTLRKANSKEQL